MKGTLLETTAGGRAAAWCRRPISPGSSRSCSSRSVSPTCSARSQTTGSQIRYVNEGTATSGAAGVAEARHKPESHAQLRRDHRAGQEDRDRPAGVSDEMLEDAPSDPGVPERQAEPVRPASKRSDSCSVGARHERADRAVQPVRRPGDQHLYEARRGRQHGRAREGDRQHRRHRRSCSRTRSSYTRRNWLSSRLLRDGTGGTVGQYLRRRSVLRRVRQRGAAPRDVRPAAVEHPGCAFHRGRRRAPRWSGTSASAPTCGAEAACRVEATNSHSRPAS